MSDSKPSGFMPGPSLPPQQPSPNMPPPNRPFDQRVQVRRNRDAALRMGVIPASVIFAVFNWALYILGAVLIVVSVIGTFYGGRWQQAPSSIAALWDDISAAPGLFFLMSVVQLLLMLTQWVALLKRGESPYWWLTYIVALVISAAFNLRSYTGVLVDVIGVPMVLAVIVIISVDILQEAVFVGKEV